MTAFTEGYCGDGRTLCPGGGYGRSYDVERGRSFAEGFTQGIGGSSDGGLGLPGFLFLFLIASAIVFFRAKAKDVSPVFYARSKYKKIHRRFNSRSVVERVVSEYNSGVDPDRAASHTNSSLVGSFVALRNTSGDLLAEIPLEVEDQDKGESFESWLANSQSAALSSFNRLVASTKFQFPHSDSAKSCPLPISA
jgi:hypothetical protein